MTPPSHPVSAAQPSTVNVGLALRAAREQLAWPLVGVAAQLRIRPCYLEALEAGHAISLPRAYRVGFLRAYSRALGLDPEDTVRRLKAESGDIAQRTELVFPLPQPDRSTPTGVLLLGLVLMVGAYAGWDRLAGETLPVDTVAAIPERLASLAEPAIHLAPVTVTVAVDTRLAAPPIVLFVRPPAVAPAYSPGSAVAAPAREPMISTPPGRPPGL